MVQSLRHSTGQCLVRWVRGASMIDIEAVMTILAFATGVPLMIWADRDYKKPRPYDWARDRWYDDNNDRPV